MSKARPLSDLLAMNRNALTVYGSLRWIAGERRQLNTTRQTITQVCGLHAKRITEAMTALNECGWVIVNYGRQGTKTWYRLTFPVGQFFPVGMKTTLRERKVKDKKDPQGTVPCDDKKDPQSLKRLGEPSALVGDGVAIPIWESRGARLERERMQLIRDQRIWSEAT